ncbi:MAG TPA: arylesterase [Hyphomonadaceae bacterium]|nr:arylesterase [Hyphomonadaceae bacterium]HPI48760.1 arylesterase [Hyphomonadaceae bacterium]
MRRLIVITALLLSSCGQPATPVANAPAASEGSGMTKPHVPTVVMLGDSLTAGYDLSDDEALPAVVERLLAAKGVQAHFVNAGVSGDTTADGLNRYDWSVQGTNADLLVVALGANDFLMGLPPERPKKNLAAILDRAKADSIPAALIGVAITGQDADPRDAAYAAIYPDLAKEYGIPYQPNFMAPIAGKSGLLMDDGLHPTARGVEAMAEGVAEFLAPVIAALD